MIVKNKEFNPTWLNFTYLIGYQTNSKMFENTILDYSAVGSSFHFLQGKSSFLHAANLYIYINRHDRESTKAHSFRANENIYYMLQNSGL